MACAFLHLVVDRAALAEPPALEAIYPPGSGPGITNRVTVSGKFDPWPPKVWISGPGVEFAPETNKGKFSVTTAPDAPAGPRLVRFYNDEGTSLPRLFVIGAGSEVTDAETNNHFARPQAIPPLPVTISGKLDRSGDVDSFALHLRGGQWLDAQVDSYTLMSKLDAVLRLVTTNGQQLAWNHDFATLDPRLVWRAPADQAVVLQIFGFPYPATADVKLYGGDSAFYRLRLSANDRNPIDAPGSAEISATNRLHLPFTIRSRLDEGGEINRVRFAANAGDVVEARIAAAALGSLLDPWLRIEDESGKELARNDDSEGSRDSLIEWKAPTNGTFVVAVSSLTHRGGPDYRYELTLKSVAPDFRTSLSVGSLEMAPDTTNSVKINIKRLRGHTNELIASLHGLPAGVTGSSSNVPPAGGDISLPIIAATNAPPFQGPVQVLITDSTGQKQLVPFLLTSRTEDNGVPGGYSRLLIDTIDHFWLTVRPPAPQPAAQTAKN